MQSNFFFFSKRKEGYVAILKNGVAELLTGKEVRAYEKFFKEEEAGSVSEIRGNIANRGRAKGKVRLVSFTAPD